jgi:hypothetical protein
MSNLILIHPIKEYIYAIRDYQQEFIDHREKGNGDSVLHR